MEFLIKNPDVLKSLTIRPGGMIILASIFEAKFSESEFNRMIKELYELETLQQVEEMREAAKKPISNDEAAV